MAPLRAFLVLLFILGTPIFAIAAEAKATPAPTPDAGIILEVDRAASGQPLVHFWSLCVGAGRANEGLRASWLEHLQMVHEACGFRYVRFHGLFHDDMFVYREDKKKKTHSYNFQYIDDVFDRMLEKKVRPFVELSFSPGAMASTKQNVFWWRANGSPPKDPAKWAELVTAFLRHCIDRYGIEEVRQWYFEVWNEPNLKSFFDGTKQQYFNLYRTTVRAVKKVDPQLRVGGPATSNFVADGRFSGQREKFKRGVKITDKTKWRPVWIEDFLAFCAEYKVPVDFVSTHPYPTDFAIDENKKRYGYLREADATRVDLQTLREIVGKSAFPKAEIHLTEWSSSPSSRDFTHDYLQAATFVVKSNLESAGLVDSMAYWTFTDVFEEAGGGATLFHGGFGLVNYQGIPKPTFHAYRFLNALGDKRIATTPGAIVTRDTATGKLSALVYQYPPEMLKAINGSSGDRKKAEADLAMGKLRPLRVQWTGMTPGAIVRVETLDKTHGNAMAAWKAIGEPAAPTREQTADLRKAAASTLVEEFPVDTDGKFTFDRPIDPWSVVLLKEL